MTSVPTEPTVPSPGWGSEQPPRQFGRYRVEQRLGAGGMGEVWKGWDEQLQRYVALKFLRGTNDEEIARFTREAQVAAKLSHPNIAAVYEVGELAGPSFAPGGGASEGKRRYIAMQYVAGTTLKGGAGRDRASLIRLVRDAALAVEYAHGQGVIHRDLKPENLMVEGERVYVMDFGLAKQSAVQSTLSASGIAVGTPAYMPPEQARGETGAVGVRSDVYSLGATLYEILAKRPPFEGSDLYDVLRRVIEDDPAALERGVDRDLRTIVTKSLEKDPARRYGTAKELADDLSRWLDGEPISARPVGMARRVGRRLRRHKAVSAALVALLAVAAVAGVLMSRQSTKAREELAAEESQTKLTRAHAAAVEARRDMRQLRLPYAEARRKLEGAIESAGEVVRARAQEPQGYYVRARGELYLGRHDEALRDALKAVELRPEFRPGWTLLGFVRLEIYTATTYALAGEPAGGQESVLVSAIDAFDRGPEAGREGEEAARWGLAVVPEDEVAKRVAGAWKMSRLERDAAGAARMLRELWGAYRSEEIATMIGGLERSSEESVRWHTEALNLAPGFVDALLGRGSSREELRDLAGALADYTRAIELREDFVGAWFNRGRVRFEQGETEGAARDFERVIELRPEMGRAHYRLSLARREAGRREEALAEIDRALALSPGMVDALGERLALREERGDRAGAAEDAARLRELGADPAERYYQRGKWKVERRRGADALGDFRRALELKPDHVNALVALGLVLKEAGDPAGAIRHLDRAIELDGKVPSAYLNRGNARLALGDPKGAIEDYGRSLALDPSHAMTYVNRALALQALREFDKAITDCDRAISIKPDYADAFFNRGNNRLGKGDMIGAVTDWDRAIQLDPRHGLALVNRGITHLRLKNQAAAQRDLDRAVELMPGDPAARLNRALALEAGGKVKEAAAELRECLRIAPPGWAHREAARRRLEGMGE